MWEDQEWLQGKWFHEDQYRPTSNAASVKEVLILDKEEHGVQNMAFSRKNTHIYLQGRIFSLFSRKKKN